jgi:hypothetical protein
LTVESARFKVESARFKVESARFKVDKPVLKPVTCPSFNL